MIKMASENIKKLGDVSINDIAELIDIVTKLMEEYNEKISLVNKYYYITLYGLQTLPIPSTSSIPEE